MGVKLSEILDPALRASLSALIPAQTVTRYQGEGEFGTKPGTEHEYSRFRVPNQTEQEAFDLLGLLHRGCIYEARTFEVVGHSYTPDWTGPSVAVEVKGEHVHSRDSRILFDAARLAHPELTWIWARKRQGGKKGDRWEVTIWQRKI